jgi:hypothetical protein
MFDPQSPAPALEAGIQNQLFSEIDDRFCVRSRNDPELIAVVSGRNRSRYSAKIVDGRRGSRSMETSEREVLEKLRSAAEEAEALFSNAGQELQERTAVAGLLRVGPHASSRFAATMPDGHLFGERIGGSRFRIRLFTGTR